MAKKTKKAAGGLGSMSNRITLAAVLFLVVLFLGLWMFNHVHAWTGVAIVILDLYAAVRLAIRFIHQLNSK